MTAMRQMAKLLAAGVAAVLGGAAPAHILLPEPLGRTISDAAHFRGTILQLHGQTRQQVGLPPLEWDESLAQDAERYARFLAATGRFEHSDEKVGEQGENLWMGTRGAYTLSHMISRWADEARYYAPRPFPYVSRTASWSDVGHYTQMVWKGTRQVGCALVPNRDDEYLVCRYAPAGNVDGEMAF